MRPPRTKGSLGASRGPRRAQAPLLVLARLLLLAALAPESHAEGAALAVVESIETSPAVFVPGDTVTLYARLAAPAGAWRPERLEYAVLARDEAASPAPPALEPVVLAATLENDGGRPRLVVRFIPWAAGELALPELAIGGLLVPRLNLRCASALASGDARPPVALPQLDPPGLFTRLYLISGLVLVLALAGAVLGLKALPAFQAFRARRAFARARRDFDEAIAGLSGCEPAAWAALSTALRRFSGLRADLDLLPLTPGEVLALDPGALPGETRDELADLLARGDEVRYGARRDIDVAAAVASALALADRMDAVAEASP